MLANAEDSQPESGAGRSKVKIHHYYCSGCGTKLYDGEAHDMMDDYGLGGCPSCGRRGSKYVEKIV